MILVPALNLLFRYVVAERIGTILLSALVAHTGWHWATERGAQLLQYPWPAFDTALLLTGVRMLIVMVAAAGLVWLLFGVMLKSVQRSQRSAVQSHARSSLDRQAVNLGNA